MSLTLQVRANQWREHLLAFVGAYPDIVPVTKGNGYGFGTPVLAAEAAALGVNTIAVGTYGEVDAAAKTFRGDVLVLTPWRSAADLGADRIVHTVSRLADLRALAMNVAETGRRLQVVVEVLTSMRRHGIAAEEVGEAAALADRLRFRGWAVHLPLAGDRLAEARRAIAAIAAAGTGEGANAAPTAAPVWVSHLDPTDARQLAAETGAAIRLRVGTALWLGDRAALQARATVLDVHEVRPGQRYGYRQRRARGRGALVVVAGGTAHGVALEAPAPASSLRQRAVSVASGFLDATGRALSPFYVAGKRRWFAEPPHMQCSLIWLPAQVQPPAAGDELDVDVRFTTTTFDRIAWV